MDPWRQGIAEQQIAQMRQDTARQRIGNLKPHQIEALGAVETGGEALASKDHFTLDVLGSMGLLQRQRGSRRKQDWRLTDEGRRALAQHQRGKQ